VLCNIEHVLHRYIGLLWYSAQCVLMEQLTVVEHGTKCTEETVDCCGTRHKVYRGNSGLLWNRAQSVRTSYTMVYTPRH
jgi:hypothetical protein